MTRKTVCQLLAATLELRNDEIACQILSGDRWISLTWREYLNTIELAAAAMRKTGIQEGDHVVLFASSRLEWAASDWAIMALRGITVPIYHSISDEELKFILEDSHPRLIFCEGEKHLKKIMRSRPDLVDEGRVITMDPPKEAHANVRTWSQFLDQGQEYRRSNEFKIVDELENTSLDDMISIIYTSGTTGQPKGVVLTHAQASSEVTEAFPLLGLTANDQSLSFLPYAHVLGRIEHWGHGVVGFKLAFCPSIDRIRDHLVTIKPTVLMTVPRLMEKIYAGILAQVETHPLKKNLFMWALELGKTVSNNHLQGKSTPVATLAMYRMAKELVLNRVADQLGGRLRFAVCGGAPLSAEIAQFFHAIGILLLEGYGLTETTAAIAVNTPFDFKFGTVGKPIGDVQIQLADDGEVKVRSLKVMREYYKQPEATAAVFRDGWLYTGDIGEFDERGFLRITDRKKDLIKTSGGKYVAPQKLESFLKTHPWISQILIYGDQKKYVTALFTLNMDAVRKSDENNQLAENDLSAPAQSQRVREILRKHLSEVNAKLASFETIKNFAVLDRDFTVESGELTPSLKVKRKVVIEKYKPILEGLY